MGALNLNDILVTSLKRIPTVGGDVLHALKNSDTGFNSFGEVYFSWVEQGAIKALKCHQRMTLNLVVPMGEVRLVKNDMYALLYLQEFGLVFRAEVPVKVY